MIGRVYRERPAQQRAQVTWDYCERQFGPLSSIQYKNRPFQPNARSWWVVTLENGDVRELDSNQIP